jgi:hypothetical protein
MFSYAANIIERKAVRIGFIILGVAASIVFIPYALFTTAVGVSVIIDFDAADYSKFSSYAFIGIGSLYGIVSAWVRVLLSNEALRNYRLLRYSVIIGLAFGVAVSTSLAWLSASSPGFIWFWLFVALASIGGFLVAATMGAMHNA